MEVITNGYLRKCKDNLGGLEKVYLFPFVKYSRKEIITNGNILEGFPITLIYPFHTTGNATFTESQSTEIGGKFFNQSITLTFKNYSDIQLFLKKDYRIIAKDRNGYFRILGLYNGLISDSLTYNTGGGKSDLNGFNLTFEGRELNQAHFINNLTDAGFIPVGEVTPILASSSLPASLSALASATFI